MLEYEFRAQFYEDGSIVFPDIDGVVASGETFFHQMEVAEDVLRDYLVSSIENGECIPYPDYKAGISINVYI